MTREGGGEIAEGTRGGGEIAEGACNLGIEEERLVECGGNVRGVRALEGGARVAERLEDSGVERLKGVRRLAGLKGALDELGGGGLGAIAQGIPALRRAGGRGIGRGRGDGGAPLKVVAGEIVPIPLVLIEALVRDAVAATAVPVVPDSDNLAEPPGIGLAAAPRLPADVDTCAYRHVDGGERGFGR